MEKNSDIEIFRLFFYSKNGGMRPKSFKCSLAIPYSATYLLEEGARISLKVAIKVSPRGIKTLKFRFLGCCSKAKTEKYD